MKQFVGGNKIRIGSGFTELDQNFQNWRIFRITMYTYLRLFEIFLHNGFSPTISEAAVYRIKSSVY